jgi:phosphoesterase RecJ-like protein
VIPDCVKKHIQEGHKFLISTHINPDADGVGACVALCWLLWKIGKKAHILNLERLPVKFNFLESIFDISDQVNEAAKDADTWMILDSSRLERVGFDQMPSGKAMVNIDHHVDNEFFGQCNWVDPRAPATSEMIYWLIKEYGFFPDKEIAEVLYTGMLIDTGGFKFSNTNSRAFKVCEELADCGIDCHGLYKTVFMDKSINRLQLEGWLKSHARLLFDNKVCLMEVTDETFRTTGTGHSDLEGISNLPMDVAGIEIGLIFIWKGEKTKVCFRSNGNSNVGEIASFFGGGGHAAAAGCTVDGDLKSVQKKVLDKVTEMLEPAHS